MNKTSKTGIAIRAILSAWIKDGMCYYPSGVRETPDTQRMQRKKEAVKEERGTESMETVGEEF